MTIPREGALAVLRNRRGLITSVKESGYTNEEKVRMVKVEYTDHEGQPEDTVIWEREPGAQVIEPSSLPQVDTTSPMMADQFDALVRAVRWSAINPYVDAQGQSMTDKMPVAAPFHGAIQVEDFQLVPLLKALKMPRVSLFLCDDVGLGKTIEAGLIISEFLLRRKIRRILIITPASLCTQWKQEMHDKFSIDFDIVDRMETHKLRQEIGMDANPWRSFSRIIASYYYLKQPDILEQFLSATRYDEGSPHLPWDLLVVDEVHNLTPNFFGEDSDLAKLLRRITPYFEHKIFLTATPHNGHTRSFTGLLECLDPVRFSQKTELNPAEKERVRDVLIRRLKREINEHTDPPRFCEREPLSICLNEYLSPEERDLAERFRDFRTALRRVIKGQSHKERIAGNFAVEILGKRLLSCPVAFADSWFRYKAGLEDEEASIFEVGAAERAVNEETGDDSEAESRVAHASKTVGAWLKNYAEALETEISDIDEAIEDLGLKSPDPEVGTHVQNPVKDAKFDALTDWIDERLRNGREWKEDERLVLFTEYKTTLDYLSRRLREHYKGDDFLAVLYGNMPMNLRDDVKVAFNDPKEPIRILLATDTASEGLNLQETARYMIHFDVPWNPSRIEQRNGRLDRHGQSRNVEIFHYYSDDVQEMKFLAYVVKKVDTIRDDLGNVEELFCHGIKQHLIEGESAESVQNKIDMGTTTKEKPDYQRDNDSTTQAAGRNGLEEVEQLKRDLDIDTWSLKETLDIAVGLGGPGRVFEEPDALGRVVFKPNIIPSDWKDLVHENLTVQVGKSRGVLQKLAFDPDIFISMVNKRPVYRVRKDTALMHFAHPIFHRAIATFNRARFPGSEQSRAATRWTLRRGGMKSSGDAEVLLTVEEMAVNKLREIFHHWVHTYRFSLKGGVLRPLEDYEPALDMRASGETSQDGIGFVQELWMEHDLEDQLKEFVTKRKRELTDLLDQELKTNGHVSIEEEGKRYQSRQGELSALIESQTTKSTQKEIEKLKSDQQQLKLFDTEAEYHRKTLEIQDLEVELKRRTEQYERMRALLDKERERIIKVVIPNRFAIKGEAQVYPVAVEIRIPEEGGR